MRKIYNLYADFETTNCDKPEVYSWQVGFSHLLNVSNSRLPNSIYRNEMKEYTGISIESFIDFIQSLKKDCIMYFNNLKGFDGHFIIPALDKAGYVQKVDYPEDNGKNLFGWEKELFKNRLHAIASKLLTEDPTIVKLNAKEKQKLIKRNWGLLLPKEYSIIVNDNHKIMEIKIGLVNEKLTTGKRKYRALIIRDNLTLFPTSIGEAGEMLSSIAQKQGMAKFIADGKFLKKELKGGYYRKEKYSSFEEFLNDGNQKAYLSQDVYILYKFHEYMASHFDSSKWKMTIASTSYNEWLNIYGDELVEKLIKAKKVKTQSQKNGGITYRFNNRTYSKSALGSKIIDKILPTEFLSSKNSKGMTFYECIYQYYRGGITKVNEEFRGKFMEMITFIDINSSYPSQMVKNALAPIGEVFEGDMGADFEYKYYKLEPLKDITNKEGLPFLFSSLQKKREYPKTLKAGEIYRFTTSLKEQVDKYYLKDVPKSAYKLTIEMSAKAVPIKQHFKAYMDKWYSVKEQASKDGDKILKFIAKLFMNSLYGKYGTKDFRESRKWNQKEQVWEKFEEQVTPKFYLPFAITIVELAIATLVEGVGTNYKNFLYCDTDSIAVVNFKPENHPNLELDPDKLGAWAVEFDNAWGVVRRPKQYFLRNDTGTKIAFAGINFNKFLMDDEEVEESIVNEKELDKLTILDFIKGITIGNQTAPKRVLGYGVLIESDVEKEIIPMWNFPQKELLTEQINKDYKDFLSSIKALEAIPIDKIKYLKK